MVLVCLSRVELLCTDKGQCGVSGRWPLRAFSGANDLAGAWECSRGLLHGGRLVRGMICKHNCTKLRCFLRGV